MTHLVAKGEEKVFTDKYLKDTKKILKPLTVFERQKRDGGQNI